MQRKIHNQTLFVAALSVYLGLLIVGAPSHVLAQEIENQARRLDSKVTLNRRSFDDFAKKLKQQILLGQVNLDNSCSVSVKANLGEDGRLENARIISKTGDTALSQAAVNLISAFSDSRIFVYLRDLPIVSSEITITLDADKGNFSLTNALPFESAQKAKQFASSANLALQMSQDNQKKASAMAQDFLRNTRISALDKEFIIVTALPRSALDSFLNANEKAN